MGSSLCKPKTKKITTSSWVANENDNPFEHVFTKKERVLLRETYQRLNDPKEVVGRIFMDIVSEIAPELKKVFGVDRAPKATMLKMPKFGGHVARMTDFIEQMTTMLGFTENIIGAWQLARKTGRLHVKVQFMYEHQNQLEKNYFSIVTDYFIDQFVLYVSGQKPEPNPSKEEDKKVRFGQNYSNQQINEAWRRFFNLIGSQFTESFEMERQKSLSNESKKTLDPHQHFKEEADKKRRLKERQSEIDTATTNDNERNEEQMFEDPF